MPLTAKPTESVFVRKGGYSLSNCITPFLYIGTGSPAISGEGFTDIVARAQAQLGKPYEWAKYGPNTFDCSGLVS